MIIIFDGTGVSAVETVRLKWNWFESSGNGFTINGTGLTFSGDGLIN